jgi:cytochrome c556
MKSQLVAASLAMALGAVFTLDAVAQSKPDVLVAQRQAVMTLQGKYIATIFGMAQGKIPYNASVVQRNAGFLDALSKMPWEDFDPSTKGVKSGALPPVWEKPAEFKQAQERLQGEVSKLVQVSKGSDEGAAKAQIGATAKACAACHETFREKR